MGVSVAIGVHLEGRFTLADELAQRGARSIYLGIDTVSQMRCEVHVLAGIASDDERIEFTREAELLSRIDHPGCLSVAGIGGLPDGTLYFIVSERSGIRIKDRRGERLPTFHVADAAAQLLRALEHIHSLEWRLGWIMPDQVDERVEHGRLLVRIVRMPSARPADESGPIPPEAAKDYAAAEMMAGDSATVKSDLYSIGRLVSDMASGGTDLPLPYSTEEERALAKLVGGICGLEPTKVLVTAADAAEAFEQLCTTWHGTPPVVPMVSRGAGQSRLRTADMLGIPRLASPQAVISPVPSSPSLLPPEAETSGSTSTPRLHPPGMGTTGMAIESAPRRSRRWWPSAAAVLLMAAGVIVFANRPSQAPADPIESSDVVAVGAASATLNYASPISAMQGNDPMRMIAELNRTEFDRVLRYVDRHALLDTIEHRPDLRHRIDMRWHRLLDLVQAADSPRPCSTFRDALSELETPPQSPVETQLVAMIVVPTPATVLGAGIAPDGDCTGLSKAFARTQQASLFERESGVTEELAPFVKSEPTKRVRSQRTKSRGAKRRPSVKVSATTSEPEGVTNPPPRVATRLDDDIKGINL